MFPMLDIRNSVLDKFTLTCIYHKPAGHQGITQRRVGDSRGQFVGVIMRSHACLPGEFAQRFDQRSRHALTA
jgi:hypothetical protein